MACKQFYSLKMKKTAILIVFIILPYISNAQILDIYTTLTSETPRNAYLKDLVNFQNQFEGTWLYQNGQEYLEVRFVKKEMMLWNIGPNQYYEDNLVGEYKYIDSNGVQKVNSLSNLNISHNSVFAYNIHGNIKLSMDDYPRCSVCPPGTERFYLFFDEPANDDMMLSANFIIRRVIESGVVKLKVQFVQYSRANGRKKGDFVSPSFFREFSLPYGNYTLIKQ